jgi:prefoldin subunit 5
MNKKEMTESLVNQAQQLAQELQEIERQFVAKKEQFLKVQGALEALSNLENDEQE